MNPIRIAVIGSGIFARDAHVPALKNLPDDFKIVAVFSRSQEKAAALAELAGNSPAIYTDLDALLAQDDIEAVDVLVPIEQLPETVEMALKAGKHVVSEKPIATDVETGRKLLSVYAAYPDRIWMVAENWRYESAFVTAASLMERLAIGTPLVCYWTVHNPMMPDNKYYHTPWRRSGTFPGGFLLDIGVHHVAAMRLVMGQEISRVAAYTRQIRSDLPPADTISAILEFESGIIGHYTASYAVKAPFPMYLTIIGDKGALRADRGVLEITVDGTTENVPLANVRNVNEELKAFAAAVRQGEPHRNTPQAALQDLIVIEAMLASADAGASVQVERV